MKRGPAVPYANAPTAVQLALPHTIPGPADSPNDRGECLEIVDDFGGKQFPFLRCDGRMEASHEYVIRDEVAGYLVRWTCSKCGKVVVP